MNLNNLQQNLHKKFKNIQSKLSDLNTRFDKYTKDIKERRLLDKLSMNNLSPNRVSKDRLKKKRKIIIIACLVVFIATIIITTATIVDKNKLVSQASCDEEAMRVRNLEPLMDEDTSYLTKPYATTDFVQPWLFTDYTPEQIYAHVKMLKSAGYENIVLQNVATLSGGSKNDAKITSAWYETTLSNDTKALDIYNPTFLDTLIDAVASLDMGIYIGPAISNDWINHAYTNSTWNYCNAVLINSIIKDIYSRYGNYSCFKGWYLGFDIYTNDKDYEEHWIELLNYILNYVTSLESSGISHPIMITPSFNNSYKMKSNDVYAFWKNIILNTNFRTNDIICLFDGLGTSDIKPDIITDYIIQTKKAVNSSSTDIDFWLCVENFRDLDTNVKPADMVRFKIQLELCSKLTDTLASYSYSHYYNPKYVDSSYNTEYLTYLTESVSDIKIDKSSNKKTTNNTKKKKNKSKKATKKDSSKNSKDTTNMTSASTKGISLEFESSNIATPTGGYVYKDKNGELAPIPQGFSVSSYANTINEGLVIKDKHQNEYVWIPVKDGIMPNGYSYNDNNKKVIYYARYTNTDVSPTSVTNDSLPNGVLTDTAQIEKYHGFYVGRYESSFNYNLGQPTCQVKYTTNNNADLSFSWKYCNSNTYTGYTWNNITYTDAKNMAENMATKYNYSETVKTGLINGTQWDTIMRFIETSSLVDNITNDSKTWGNYTDAITPANTLNYQMGILKPSGSNIKWSIKNIYDLAGNLSEWTSELSDNKYVIRGGSFNQKGSINGACYSQILANDVYTNTGFRVVLYIN